MQPLNFPAQEAHQEDAGYYTGKLIEEAGLKGFRIGGRRFPKHAASLL